MRRLALATVSRAGGLAAFLGRDRSSMRATSHTLVHDTWLKAFGGKAEHRANLREPGAIGRAELAVGPAHRKGDAHDELGCLSILTVTSRHADV